MKILITGGHGFVGRFLGQYLAHSHEVYAPGRDQLDVCDPGAVDRVLSNGYDWIIHCAVSGRNQTLSTDPAIVSNNIRALNNILSKRDRWGALINVASGAEFDLDTDIDCAREQDIWIRNPQHSYGLSKNLTARIVAALPNCINLRLFGCFDPSESDLRVIKRCQRLVSQGLPFLIEDRPFDTVSVGDFARVVSAVLDGKIRDNDLNVVYNKKHTLGETLKIYCRLHNYDPDLIRISDKPGRSYTGDGSRLHAHALPLLGLEQSLREYL